MKRDPYRSKEVFEKWLFHIALDNLDTSVKNDWMHNLTDSNFHGFGFCENGFIHYTEAEVDEDGLQEGFDIWDEANDEEDEED